ncbi:MAG: hypothetical protein RLZZ326_3919, partial [Planctomycetota bacterium]
LLPGTTYAPVAAFSGTPTTSTVTVVGSVDLGGSTLAFAASGSAAVGQSVILVANDGTDSVVGRFAGLADGAVLIADNGQTFQINYAGGDGNDVVLTRSIVSLTVSGITVGTRSYNGTSAAPLDTSLAALVGLAIGDTTTTLLLGGVSGAYGSPDFGSGKSVTVTGLALAGAVSGNYVLVMPELTGTVDKAAALFTVTPYLVTYSPWSGGSLASGTAQGIDGAALAGSFSFGTPHIEAGTYQDAWTFTADNPNYESASGTVTNVIDKARAIISGPYSWRAYDGSNHPAGMFHAYTIDWQWLGQYFTNELHRDAGSYLDTWNFTSPNPNYADESGSVSTTIYQAYPTVSVTPYTVTYDAQPHAATGTATGGNSEVQGSPLVDLTAGLTITSTHSDAGTYVDSWTFTSPDSNYENTTGTVTNTIRKAAATIAVTPSTATYDGLPHRATGTAIGVNGENLSAGLILDSTEHVNAGTYTDHYRFISPDPNYADVNPGSVTWLDDEFPPGWDFTSDTVWYSSDVPGEVLSGTRSLDRTIPAWDSLGQDFAWMAADDARPLIVPGDGLITAHVWLDPENKPGTVMLQFLTAERGWESRAVWGEQHSIYWGEYWNPVSPSHFMMGGIPDAGSWIALTVNASDLGLSPGQEIRGIAFTATAGHLRWDLQGTGFPENPPATEVVTTIAKRQAEITITPFNLTFDGQPHTPAASALGLGGIDLSQGISFGGAATAPGTHRFDWTLTSPDPNYADASGTVTSTISVPETINAPPVAADRTLSIAEDTPSTFSSSDFGFSDPDNDPANGFLAVEIVTIPSSGILVLGGNQTISGPTSIPVTALDQLVYHPAPDAFGHGLASFTFRVRDDGGTRNGGNDTSTGTSTIAFDAAPRPDAMTGTVRIENRTSADRGTSAARDTDSLLAVPELADADGLGTFTYQWLRNSEPIPQAIFDTYVLVPADIGATISIRMTQTDGGGTTESATSPATELIANLDDPVTGEVTITNATDAGRSLATPWQRDTLRVSQTLVDPDGIVAIAFQWFRGSVAIDGATGTEYQLRQADVGAAIRVVASTTDAFGGTGVVSSAATGAVVDVNDPMTGSVTIANLTDSVRGTAQARQGDELSASHLLDDIDGIGPVTLQWFRGSQPIEGATGSRYRLVQADVSQLIRARATQIDSLGNTELVSSAA